MKRNPFPDGPYYMYYLSASFQQRVKLPPVIQQNLGLYQMLELSGAQITPQIVDALLQAICQGKLHNLYLTPFRPSCSCGLDPRQMADQWACVTYTHGVGAMIWDDCRAAAYFNRLDEYTLNRPIRLTAGKTPPAHSPILFASNEDMAEAVGNLILTGSLDGSRERPPVPSAARRGADPSLLRWIENVLGHPLQSPDSLDRVTGLTANYFVSGYPAFPDWLAPEPGNWSLLGEMPNLSALFMPRVQLDNYDFLLHCSGLRRLSLINTNLSDPALLENLPLLSYLELPPAEWKDYSFLLRCPELEILDLSRTDFRDCSLLTQLPNLGLVRLPAERQLLHLELLDPLPLQVKTDARRVRGAGIDPFEIVPPSPVEMPDIAPPYKALHIDADGCTCEGLDITEKYVKKLLKDIRNEDIEEVYISPERWGEEEFLDIAIAGGWAALSLSDPESPEVWCIYNPEHRGDYEDAPPELGGQSPVPKVHAIEDLDLAACCAAYYIKTGKLYPGAYWAKYYSE